MRTITKRELNQQTAAVLAKVTEADVVVTERGKPRWRVSAVRDADTVLARLERAGRYTPPAAEPAPWSAAPNGPSYTTGEANALIDEMHGDH